MFAKGQTVIQWMEQLAPKHLAVPDDRIGLQLGSLQKDITHVLVALDVTNEVVDEAIRIGANLIIAHHAIIFRPVKTLSTDTPMGKLYEKLIKHDIAVYISHTNLDIAEGGINDWMAEALGIESKESLEDVHTDQLYKLAVFVPRKHHEQVLHAILEAGAGSIGQYNKCSFSTEGTGTFVPGEGTQPFIGSQGQMERVEEMRIETVVPQSLRGKVIQAMLKAHPYEEVAYDLYAMDLKGRTLGLGRLGPLRESKTLGELVEVVKAELNVPHVRVVGDLNKKIKKVAVLGGSGSRYVLTARFKGADVIVTGDIDYHTAHDALMAGMCIIDPGHNTEKIMKPKTADWLRGRLADQRYETQVTASQVDTEVFRFV
ncbi:Nif3-like dinuclear metal center hexameric protein [Paenibacillus sp. RRE4]|uniref:Nif3-like dinuclear metal center hexameric protein n=1 Tax=Paenibacillus sp. RRE4 TaxID=2962587 RepID=UPI0028815EF7|nr:Nif3-like dinuclear metal center hexameric protein [Paenibacillus sp. RRE4]MDT0124048.1 Nif3-like dinuclear metal center hexameric protein [Paenibacillus sp. RRE4]